MRRKHRNHYNFHTRLSILFISLGLFTCGIYFYLYQTRSMTDVFVYQGRSYALFNASEFTNMSLASPLSAITTTKITEGLQLAEGLKTNIVNYHATTGKWPQNNQEAGFTTIKKEGVVDSIMLHAGTPPALIINYHESIGGSLQLIPSYQPENGNYSWQCRSLSAAINDLIPANCQHSDK